MPTLKLPCPRACRFAFLLLALAASAPCRADVVTATDVNVASPAATLPVLYTFRTFDDCVAEAANANRADATILFPGGTDAAAACRQLFPSDLLSGPVLALLETQFSSPDQGSCLNDVSTNILQAAGMPDFADAGTDAVAFCGGMFSASSGTATDGTTGSSTSTASTSTDNSTLASDAPSASLGPAASGGEITFQFAAPGSPAAAP